MSQEIIADGNVQILKKEEMIEPKVKKNERTLIYEDIVLENYDGNSCGVHLLFDINGTLGSLTKHAKYINGGNLNLNCIY